MSTTIIRPALQGALRSSKLHQLPPAFLLPSLFTPKQQSSSFSSTTTNAYPRDMNRERGVSTQRRTGLRQPVSVSKTPLPEPIRDYKPQPEVDPDHGLYQFFHKKDECMNTPEEDAEHGRPWSAEELRHKSWEDLHALYWVCAKERNVIATETYERKRLEAGYGDHESEERERQVKRTQRAIKHVLTERYYSWKDATENFVKNDPEINLSGEGPLYQPSDFLEAEDAEPVEEAELLEDTPATPPPEPKSQQPPAPSV